MYYCKVNVKFSKDSLALRKNEGNKPLLLKEEDYKDYYIIKSSANFKFVEDFSDLYSKYLLIKKDKIKKEDYEKWFDFIKESKLIFTYLNLELPPISLIQKIKVIKPI